jgi:hypothetical protein
MKVADVRVSWQSSVSTDVVSQLVELKGLTGEVLKEVTLAAEATEVVLEGLQEKTDYLVVVTVTDGTTSAASSLQFNLGDLTPVQPVTGLKVDVVAVRDVE